MTDLSNVPKVEPDCLEVRQTSAGPLGVGTTLEVRRAKMPKVAPERVIEYTPNRKFTFEITSGPAKRTIVTYSMETIEGKTRFTETADYKLGGFYKLVGPFVARSLKRKGAASVANLKRILESEARS
jgi:hypothetical protein